MSADNLQHIEHIVVLMMENRSFDNILGWQFGLDPNLSNTTDQGKDIKVWNNGGTDFETMTIPTPDPGESFLDMNYQLFGNYLPDSDAQPNMSGFVRNYNNQSVASGELYNERDIMHCFEPAQVPVFSQLATSFGISDRWHASAPCQTWPNRFFLHCATAAGWVNNLPQKKSDIIHRLPYDMPTIFNQVQGKGFDKGWRIYFHDFAQTFLLSKLWDHLDHFHFYDRFKRDVDSGCLQPYTFIEPRYFPHKLSGKMPNDYHPPHDVTLGEQLVADVYNTLRANEEVWRKTFLMVIFDEHGGCYDNEPPGPATAPDDGPAKPGQYGFTFDRFGVRIPALLISPFIPAGSCHRASGPWPYDHTSVIKTVRERFAPGAGPLTNRDAAAPSLASVLSLDPDHLNMGPEKLPIPPYSPPPGTHERACNALMGDFQQAAHHLAGLLPHRSKLEKFLDGVRDRLGFHHETPRETAGDAHAFIEEKVADFLNRDPGSV